MPSVSSASVNSIEYNVHGRHISSAGFLCRRGSLLESWGSVWCGLYGEIFMTQTVICAAIIRSACPATSWLVTNWLTSPTSTFCINSSQRNYCNCCIFSGTLQLDCRFRYCHKMSSVVCRLSVCLSSVTQVYRDKTAQARIMQFSLQCNPVP